MKKIELKKLLPYIIVLGVFSLTVLVLISTADLWILPAMVHNKPIVKVPDLTGKPINEAEKLLETVGLNYEVTSEQYSKDFKPGVVISQTPKPNLMVKQTRTIFLIISKGEETAIVPYLIGQSFRIARTTLINKGFKLGNIRYEPSDAFGADTIIFQSINANTSLPFGSAIDLVVSKGSELQVKVPSLIGLSLEEAKKSLSESGLNLGNLNYIENETFMPNTVINQNPSPGALVKNLSNVNLTLSR